jgi:hypothetical protein
MGTTYLDGSGPPPATSFADLFKKVGVVVGGWEEGSGEGGCALAAPKVCEGGLRIYLPVMWCLSALHRPKATLKLRQCFQVALNSTIISHAAPSSCHVPLCAVSLLSVCVLTSPSQVA